MPHLFQPLMTQKTHRKPKNTKKKILSNKTTPPTQNSKPPKKNLKHFHKTNPTHKITKTQKQKTSSKLKSRSHPQATVYTGTKLATNTTMQSSSESDPLELTTEKLSESNPAAKRGA
jgi:hypothetical protein